MKKSTLSYGITHVTVVVVAVAGMMIMRYSMQLLSTTAYAQNSTNSTTPQQEPRIEESLIDADVLKFALFALIAQSNITGFDFS